MLVQFVANTVEVVLVVATKTEDVITKDLFLNFTFLAATLKSFCGLSVRFDIGLADFESFRRPAFQVGASWSPRFWWWRCPRFTISRIHGASIPRYTIHRLRCPWGLFSP